MIRKNYYLVAITAAMFFSCSNNKVTSEDIINIITSGSWRITYYNDSGTDETYHFTGYVFTFQSVSLISATNGINQYYGDWAVIDTNENEDNLSDLKFGILFLAPAVFEELSDDWDIKSYSTTKIELEDVSGGGSGTDLLTFEKI